MRLFRENIWAASPEDVILYKLLSAREIDLADINTIINVQGGKLDQRYLRARAQIMQQELRRPDIIKNLKKALKRR